MDLSDLHLSTFAAIIEEGSFEGAAKRLRLTPSAVSQRVRAMEERIGTVLLKRTRPVEVTAAGATVLQLARQVDRLLDDTTRELRGGERGGTATLIPIVVNADSLATWFVPALARASRETGAFFEVLRADETVSTDRLRRGDAMAALTATREAVPGCTSTRVGVDRYHPVASPAFIEQHFAEGLSADTLARAPIIEFDRKDGFQERFIRRITRVPLHPPRHFIPSSAEFIYALELGMGWGMVPERQCVEPVAAGRLAPLRAGTAIELPLFWQRWNLRSPVLDKLSTVITEEGAAALAEHPNPLTTNPKRKTS